MNQSIKKLKLKKLHILFYLMKFTNDFDYITFREAVNKVKK